MIRVAVVCQRASCSSAVLKMVATGVLEVSVGVPIPADAIDAVRGWINGAMTPGNGIRRRLPGGGGGSLSTSCFTLVPLCPLLRV